MLFKLIFLFCKCPFLIVLVVINKLLKGWWLKKVLLINLITDKNASRLNVLQPLECCIIIQMVPFNGIMNVKFDYKSVLKLSFSRKKILSHFLYFSILFQIIDRMSIVNNFQLFLRSGSLINTYTKMHSYFSTWPFGKLFLLINFSFSHTLLHYPIFLLPMEEFIVNNKQM